MFGVDEEGVTAKYADREAAVAEISANAKKISAGYTKERSTLPANSEEYVALVVYMPESVGNEANYKKGTTPPQITLGIDVFATQVEYESEKDSYGPDYDKDAPIVMDSVTTEAGKNAQLNFAAAPSTTTSSTIIDIPADALPVGSIVTAIIDTDNSLFNVNAAGAVVGAINVDMKVDGVDFDGELAAGEYFTVTTYISKGLEDVTVKYTGTDGKDDAIFVSYDPATGKLVFKTNHFSEYAVSGKALAYDIKNDVAFSEIDDVVEVLVSGETTIVIPEANKTTEFKGALEEAIAELPEEEQTIIQENLADVLYAAAIGETKYATLEDALKAAADGDTIVFLNDVIITSNWDARFTGGKMTNSVTIDGNGKTIKFTSTTDDKNHFAAFRFEKDAIVKNLTFDFSDAIGTINRARAISAKANLVVENCTFIGNPDITNDRAIIFGEGAGAAIGNVEVSVTGCTFVDWRVGVTDNENAQDAKSVVITNNTFKNASVNVSAFESVTFTGNKMDNGSVAIKSYSNAENLVVVANNNVLDETKDNTIGKTFYVVTAASMKRALNSGLSNITVILNNNIDLTESVTLAAGKNLVLDLNGYTLAGTFSGTGNQDFFLVKGNLTVNNGTITLTATQNQGWGAMSTIFDITGGGIVTLNNATIDNLGGTDMAFAVHMNNWGEVTLNANNTTFKSTYVAIRVFNSGYDMNNVTLENCTLEGGNYAFWVHNYTVADFGTEAKAEAQKKLLNLDILNGTNSFKYSKSAIRLGFTNSILMDENGCIIVSGADSLRVALTNGGIVKLYADVALDETVVIPENVKVVLDLNGKTISGTIHKNDGSIVKNEGSLTMKNGTISSTGNNGGSALVNKGSAVLENVTLNGAPTADGSWPSYTLNNTGVMTATNVKFTSYHGAVASYNNGALVTLNNCEIDMKGIPGFTSHGIYTYNNGAVVVNGGTYVNHAADQSSSGASVINGAVTVNAGTFNGRIENYYGTPVIKGGTFSVDPSRVQLSITRFRFFTLAGIFTA